MTSGLSRGPSSHARYEGQERPAPAMDGWALQERVDRVLHILFLPNNRHLLEQYRFHGSTNRVYRIPISADGKDFIIVKRLPSWWKHLKLQGKRRLRNLLYGEHDLALSRKQAQSEIARLLEWQQEGLPVPQVIPVSIPDTRVCIGLPFPTMYTILNDPAIPAQRKLSIVAAVTRALSAQHQLALHRDKKSLVHRDPGPWNIMYDLETDSTVWFDLEHPEDYPSMSLEALLTRAVRIYLHGVLVYMPDHLDDVVHAVVGNYALKHILERYVTGMERRNVPLVHRILDRLGAKGASHLLLQGVPQRVHSRLEAEASLETHRAGWAGVSASRSDLSGAPSTPSPKEGLQ
ncbi:MAG: hypothetical protein HY532_06795 [Chloroflexi bacterium]|nr:hypothetical protein [Chloroflexota bacterium]